MVDASWVKSEVLKAVPNAIVEVIDLHGSGDHFHVRVITDDFEGNQAATKATSSIGSNEATYSAPGSCA